MNMPKTDGMRILLCSYWFQPSFGGVETISKILAEEFAVAGANVTIVTQTPGPAMDLPYDVVRQPSFKTLYALAKASDVIFQNMISLRTIVPIILSRKPIVVTHQSWMRRPDGKRGLENYIKLLLVRASTNVSISKAIADSVPARSIIIGNPFEAKLFYTFPDTPRDKDIVFMGRLVSDKGCDLLLHAMAELKLRNLTPSLSIIGDGPELPTLKALTQQLNLTEQVEFLGAGGQQRGQIVARHRIMAIPSLWAEPFGVVALEGIASGCAIVASSQGGLPDAGGPCGIYFPNKNVTALADALEQVLTDSSLQSKLVSAGPEHLKKFQPGAVARRYLDLFQSVSSS
jgi:glycogen(starch) synthase